MNQTTVGQSARQVPTRASAPGPNATPIKESPYITWVKSLPAVEINLAGSAVPSCPPSALGPLDPDAPLVERNDYGWPPLVAEIAKRYAVPESSVVVAAGASMANHLAIATLINRGDHVLIERPGYDPLALVPALWGAEVDAIDRRPAAGYRFDIEAVRGALTPRTRLVVVSDLHNPTGARLDRNDLAALAALAEARDFHIIVDEVYGEWLREAGVPSTIHVSPRIVVTSSLTKVWGLGGLRIGWILAEPALAERMRRFASLFDNIMAYPSERLAVRALQRSSTIISPHATLVTHNRKLVRQWVEAHPQARWVEPATGAIAFVDLGVGDASDLVDTLARRHGTLVVPGRFFGAPEYVRIALGVDSDVLERGLKRIGPQILVHARRGHGDASALT
jgi:aspartate/methionine/tyrosine aminotransferase